VLVRLLLGMAQVCGAGFSIALLLESGVSAAALVAVVITCVLTTISVLLFGGRRSSKGRRR
jgi:hypothetical protein